MRGRHPPAVTEFADWSMELMAVLGVLASSWWVYPVLFALAFADAFIVIIPSEVALASLASLAATTGQPPLWAIIAVAAVGAFAGDIACYSIARTVGLERWRWQREGRLAAVVAKVRDLAQRRPAMLIITARYIPFARIAVNLTVGAVRLPLRRFIPLTAIASLTWAGYHTTLGTILRSVLRGQPLLAFVVTIVAALLLGIVVDRLAVWIAALRRSAARGKIASNDQGRGADDPADTAAE